MQMATTKQGKRESERRRRKISGQLAGRMGVDQSLLDLDKYQYRWVNDEANGRIQMLTKHDDYDLVPNSGEKEDSTDLGDMVSTPVGVNPDGSPKRAYLARKLRDFFEADKAQEQKELDRQLTELRRGNARDGSSQSDYIPNSGIRIEE